METNRDDINKMSNEELAATIMAKISIMPRFSSISGFTDAAKEFAEWLSQEAKETISGNIVYVSPHEIKKIELTEQEYKELVERIDRLEDNDKMNCDEFREINKRIKTLEKCNRIAEVKEHIEERLKEETKDLTKNMRPTTQEDYYEREDLYQLNNGEVKLIPKTADEMFEELGWNKEIDDEYQIEYIDLYKRVIVIHKEDFTYYKSIYGNCAGVPISEAEDKAIHKKISELKEQKNEKKG